MIVAQAMFEKYFICHSFILIIKFMTYPTFRRYDLCFIGDPGNEVLLDAATSALRAVIQKLSSIGSPKVSVPCITSCNTEI